MKVDVHYKHPVEDDITSIHVTNKKGHSFHIEEDHEGGLYIRLREPWFSQLSVIPQSGNVLIVEARR